MIPGEPPITTAALCRARVRLHLFTWAYAAGMEYEALWLGVGDEAEALRSSSAQYPTARRPMAARFVTFFPRDPRPMSSAGPFVYSSIRIR